MLTSDDEKYASMRLLLQRFENLNKQVIKGVLTGVNKPTIEEHITHIGKPNIWGTHVELFATASYFQVYTRVYVCSWWHDKSEMGSFPASHCQMPKVYATPSLWKMLNPLYTTLILTMTPSWITPQKNQAPQYPRDQLG